MVLTSFKIDRIDNKKYYSDLSRSLRDYIVQKSRANKITKDYNEATSVISSKDVDEDIKQLYKRRLAILKENHSYLNNLNDSKRANADELFKEEFKSETSFDFSAIGKTKNDLKFLADSYDNVRDSIEAAKQANYELNKQYNNGSITYEEYQKNIDINYDSIEQLTSAQKDIISHTEEINPLLAENMKISKEGTSSFNGYQQARRKLTLATIAQTAAETALNMAMTAGISAIVTLGINALTSLADAMVLTKEEAAELTEEIHNKYTELNDTLKKNTQVVEDCADRYEELSKGVDSFGRNISLTNEEFNEYNSLSNEIAEQFPNLVSGYTDTGNAILSCKDNLALLNDEYDRQQRLVQDEMIKNSQNALKAYNTTYNKQSHSGWGIAAG